MCGCFFHPTHRRAGQLCEQVNKGVWLAKALGCQDAGKLLVTRLKRDSVTRLLPAIIWLKEADCVTSQLRPPAV
jgi:hypothetical protein